MDSSKRKLGKERLQRIINLCREVEEKGLNPFVVDVNDLLAVIREYFPEWRLPEELCLDAEALHHIAAVCNEGGNVVGMMPHPERACEELLGGTDGRLILGSLC